MITQKQIDNLHTDIKQWYNDYQQDIKGYELVETQSEWYQQLKRIFDAAYWKDTDFCEQCKKLGEMTCGNDSSGRCFESNENIT